MSNGDEAWVRVCDLASELGVGSPAVLAKLEAMGEFADSFDSSIKAPVADRVRAQFSVQPVKAREDTTGWRPLNRRDADVPGEDEILYEDVPAHVPQPLCFKRQVPPGLVRHTGAHAPRENSGRNPTA